MSIKLDYCAPSEVLPRLNEWHVSDEKKFKLLRESIRDHGIMEPPLLDSENRVVFGGLIVKVALELGLNRIPVLRAENFTNDELRLYSIRAQKIADLGSYDEAVLAIELRQLEQLLEKPNFLDIGFDQGELDRILKLTELDLGLGLDDTPEADPSLIVSQPRDCWIMEGHRLLNGDALQEGNFDALMAGEKARFGLVDGPYNLARATISSNENFSDFKMAYGEMSPGEFTRFWTRVMRHMANHSLDGSLHAYFMSYHFLLELMRAGTIVFGRPNAMCTWVKPVAGRGGIFKSQTEHIVYFKNGTAPHLNHVQLGKHGRNRSTAWFYDGMTGRSPQRNELLASHPTPKNTDMLKDAILDVTNRGDIVLDPFAGSGSLIIAAHSCERRAFTMEIDPIYVDVALRRVRKTLRIEPVRESDGARFSELERALSDNRQPHVAEVENG